MRIAPLALVLAAVLVIAVSVPCVLADSGSISRDSYGTANYGTHDPLGGPPTPRIYGFGQATIFGAALALLVGAALLGVYTFATARPID
jgi:hypothetical protein